MNLSEEQIRHILNSTQVKTPLNLQLEDIIMSELAKPNHYERLIQNSRRYARIGFRISILLTVCLVLSVVYYLYSKSSSLSPGLEQVYPSLMVVAVLFLIAQLLYFGSNMGSGIGAARRLPTTD